MVRYAIKGGDSYQLILRNPETDPVPLTPIDNLPAALGFIEPSLTGRLRPRLHHAVQYGLSTSYRALLRKYSQESEQAVDRRAKPSEPWDYSCVQIGAGIASALLRVETRGDGYLLDPGGYLQAIDELEEYAYRSGLDEVSAELKKRNAAYTKASKLTPKIPTLYRAGTFTFRNPTKINIPTSHQFWPRSD